VAERQAVILTIHVPDEFVEPVKKKLENGPTGVLEAVAWDAVLGYLVHDELLRWP